MDALIYFETSLRRWLRPRILSRSGVLARWALYPKPSNRPANRTDVHVARDSGLGDVVMLTPALRALKQRRPGSKTFFYTNFGELVEGLPYIDAVLPFDSKPSDAIFVEYTDVVPSPVHIARLMGDRLGIKVSDTQPDCVIDQRLKAAFIQAWSHLPRPHLVVLRRASRFTPNKDWPTSAWAELIMRCASFGTVIEIGTDDSEPAPTPTDNYLDLRGATGLKDLVAAVAAADIYVGPVSGPMHVAAAAGVPSVVIIGGYEHPANAHYPRNVELYTPLPCAPCWLRTPCPIGQECLHAISVDKVVASINAVWAQQPLAHGQR